MTAAPPPPLRIVVTGATGFVGAHLAAAAAAAGHEVTAVGRDAARAAAAPWAGRARFLALDLAAPGAAARLLEAAGRVDALAHLAWPGLPDFRDPAHVAEHLPAALRFLGEAAALGLARRLLVAGTCLEYGLREGAQREDAPTAPTLPYPIAKDALRRTLEAMLARAAAPPRLIWARLYYLHGEGQHPKSVLPQLEAAIAAGRPRFEMSGGEQLRDYLPAPQAAAKLLALAEAGAAAGIYNICSGRPISVRRLVEERVRALGSDIALDLGRLPYPDYEPMAFWGDPRRAEAVAAGRPAAAVRAA
ncbi:MAG: NAD-dependent epimerase/dehydratase family protein [Pseudomonadota bacterium]